MKNELLKSMTRNVANVPTKISIHINENRLEMKQPSVKPKM